MSAHDKLQEQLLESVTRRAERVRPGAGAWLWVRWRGIRSRRGLLLVALPLLFAVAAAAATIVAQSGESPADALFNRVLSMTHTGATTGPCRIVGGRRRAALSDEAPDPRITAVLPQLASTPPAPASPKIVALAERNSGGPVLARTIREVQLPGNITLVLWVAHGQGPFTLLNPRRCLDARLSTLIRLRPRAHDALREEVMARLNELPDTNPGVQSLTLTHFTGGPGFSTTNGGGGSSTPLLPTDKVMPSGVMFSGDSCRRDLRRADRQHAVFRRPIMLGHFLRCSPTLYGGIAGPATAYLTVAPAPSAGDHARGVRRRITVRQGLFAFTLPPNIGPEVITQHTRSGKALSMHLLR